MSKDEVQQVISLDIFQGKGSKLGEGVVTNPFEFDKFTEKVIKYKKSVRTIFASTHPDWWSGSTKLMSLKTIGYTNDDLFPGIFICRTYYTSGGNPSTKWSVVHKDTGRSIADWFPTRDKAARAIIAALAIVPLGSMTEKQMREMDMETTARLFYIFSEYQ